MCIDYEKIEILNQYLEGESVLKLYATKILNVDKNGAMNIKQNDSGSHLRIKNAGFWIDYTRASIDIEDISNWLTKISCYYNPNDTIRKKFITERNVFTEPFEKIVKNLIELFNVVITNYPYFELIDTFGEYFEYEECIITSHKDLEYRFNCYTVVELKVCNSFNKRSGTISLNVTSSKDSECLKKDLIIELDSLFNTIYLPRFTLNDLANLVGTEVNCIAASGFSGRLIHESIGHYSESDNFQTNKVSDLVLGNKVCSNKITIVDYSSGKNVPYEFFIDEEGTQCSNATIINEGVFSGLLSDASGGSKKYYKKSGFVRSYGDSYCPLIRMRNTALLPGKDNVNEMLLGLENGIYIHTYIDGSTTKFGRFEVIAKNSFIIHNGKVIGVIDEIELYGDVSKFLESITMVGTDFSWYDNLWCCKEGQRVQVSFGSPTIKCRLEI